MYVTYAELLCEYALVSDPKVTQTDLTLSAKVVDVGGDLYTFAGGTPLVGDAVCQAGYSQEIIEIVGGTQIRIDVTGVDNKIAEGLVKQIHSDVIPKARGEFEILTAMDFIEMQTRQWFEPRTKTVRVEGKNSNVYFFPVPIISISAIRINDESASSDLNAFEIFSGVDNRRNPRIKIKSSSSSIYNESNGRAFVRAAYTEFDGSYGFVEEDGSTPRQIKKAALKLSINYINNSAASGSSLVGVGAVKREKVDLHEKEYFQPDDVTGGPSGSVSGDIEVDRILRMFRGPTSIGTTILDLPTTEDYKRDSYTGTVIY